MSLTFGSFFYLPLVSFLEVCIVSLFHVEHLHTLKRLYSKRAGILYFCIVSGNCGGYQVYAFSQFFKSGTEAGVLGVSELSHTILKAFGYWLSKQAKRHLGETLKVLQCYKKYGSSFSYCFFLQMKQLVLSAVIPGIGCNSQSLFIKADLVHTSEVVSNAHISNSAILNVVEVLSSCRLGLNRHFIADRYTLVSCSPIVT